MKEINQETQAELFLQTNHLVHLLRVKIKALEQVLINNDELKDSYHEILKELIDNDKTLAELSENLKNINSAKIEFQQLKS